VRLLPLSLTLKTGSAWLTPGGSAWLTPGGSAWLTPGGSTSVTSHTRRGSIPRAPKHPPDRKGLWPHRRPNWKAPRAEVGPDLVFLVCDPYVADKMLLQLRVLRAIVSTLEKAPPKRADATTRRISFYRSFGVRGIMTLISSAILASRRPR
jgi:hypothetical protein